MQRALFLDRDGTLVEPYHYPTLPEHLRLYPGLAPRLYHAQCLGFALVLVTNQSGIARGYLTEDDLQVMHASLAANLACFGVHLSGIYYCPHMADGSVPQYARACDCRKPAPGMLLRAAADLCLDLRTSWLIGDILDDVEAGNRAGCRTILVDLGTEAPPESAIRRPNLVARDTCHALDLLLGIEQGEKAGSPVYLPPSWRQSAVSVAPAS
jgi:D-glycero-D-manno-heptose 1,7-bisphosphate phosphatase